MLRPGDGPRDADLGAITSQPLRAIEWHLLFAGVQRVLSLPILGLEPAARFWMAYPTRMR